MERILKIEEGTFIEDRGYDGFIITTDEQTIKLGISNDQSCCENWGYFMSEEDLSEFVGAQLADIQIVTTKLETTKLVGSVYEGECMFVNLSTDRGMIQFVAYNQHNGYYGHNACVISRQLNHSETL